MSSQFHHTSTEDFFFQQGPDGVVELGFGASTVRMTFATARDLSVRLGSFLVYLQYGPQGEDVNPRWSHAECDGRCGDCDDELAVEAATDLGTREPAKVLTLVRGQT